MIMTLNLISLHRGQICNVAIAPQEEAKEQLTKQPMTLPEREFSGVSRTNRGWTVALFNSWFTAHEDPGHNNGKLNKFAGGRLLTLCHFSLREWAARMATRGKHSASPNTALTCGAGGNSDSGSLTEKPDSWESSDRNLQEISQGPHDSLLTRHNSLISPAG